LRSRHPGEFALHFTEPELAEQIVATNSHRPSIVGTSQYGIFVARLGPHPDDALSLLAKLFVGNVAKAPRLWSAIVYRTAPTARTGLHVVPDLTLASVPAFYHPTHRSGIDTVADYLLAWGVAAPYASGAQWLWAEP
jgi:hypothetical protein